MGTLGYLTIALTSLWIVPEIFIAFRRRSGNPSPSQRSPFLIYVTDYGSGVLALLIKVVPAAVAGIGGIEVLSPFSGYFGCLLMIFGLAIRGIAIKTLGPMFTVDVAVMPGHKIVDKGFYGCIRHPAYLGALLLHLGFGLALENWLSLIVVTLFPTLAVLHRISVEERALSDHFGSAYKDYMRRTKKLIPGIF